MEVLYFRYCAILFSFFKSSVTLWKLKWQSKLDTTWGNDGLFCGIRRSWALGTLSSTGFCIRTQHLCHQCLPAHPVPVLEQFLTFCSIQAPSSFQAPQAVLHSPISSSLHRCLSRTKRCLFPKRPGCLFHDTSICLSLCTSSPSAGPRFWTLLSGDQDFTQSSGFAFVSFLWFPSQRLRVPASPWPCHDALAQWILQAPVAASLTCLPLHSMAAHVPAPPEQSSPGFVWPTWAPLWGASAGICLSSKISPLALGRISLAICRIQHRRQELGRIGTELRTAAPCRAPSASSGAEPLPEESMQHIQQPPLHASSKSFKLFPSLLQVLKWSSQPQA